MLKNASAAIFAVDVAVKEEERFSHLPTIKTKVSAPLKDAKKIIETALVKAEQTARGEYVEHSRHQEAGFLETVKEAVMTGISHVIPLIVAGGMIADNLCNLCKNLWFYRFDEYRRKFGFI